LPAQRFHRLCLYDRSLGPVASLFCHKAGLFSMILTTKGPALRALSGTRPIIHPNGGGGNASGLPQYGCLQSRPGTCSAQQMRLPCRRATIFGAIRHGCNSHTGARPVGVGARSTPPPHPGPRPPRGRGNWLPSLGGGLDAIALDHIPPATSFRSGRVVVYSCRGVNPRRNSNALLLLFASRVAWCGCRKDATWSYVLPRTMAANLLFDNLPEYGQGGEP
jgi:hypothetical protein